VLHGRLYGKHEGEVREEKREEENNVLMMSSRNGTDFDTESINPLNLQCRSRCTVGGL
jgi:hypothetical protein